LKASKIKTPPERPAFKAVRRFLTLVAILTRQQPSLETVTLATKTVNPLAKNNGNNEWLWGIIIDDILAMSLS
jgi:hypothetical protein